jgi:hypothetical protein
MTDTHKPKLPIWPTAVDCYTLMWRHLRDLLRYAWPWFIALIAVSGALYWGFYPHERETITQTGAGSNTLWLSTVLASTAIGAAIAVPWHRLVLIGEQQSMAASLHLDLYKRQCLIGALALFLVPALPLLLIESLLPAAPASAAAEALSTRDLALMVVGAVFFLAIPIINRLSLVLPASALHRDDVGWAATWRMTRGNTWRMFWASFVPMLPLIAAAIVAFSIYSGVTLIEDATVAPSRAAFTLSNVLWEVGAMLFGMLYVTFLSLAYRHFFGPIERAA